MPEPFKDYFNQKMIEDMAALFARIDKNFDRSRFLSLALDRLHRLELKARVRSIMEALSATLPTDFDSFSEVVLASLHPSLDPEKDGCTFGPDGLVGFSAWPVIDLIAERGHDVPEKALPLLKEATRCFSAEFAIRPFLNDYSDLTLSVINGWVDDPNRHVRRLVSEGTRPRLPWGMRLQEFIEDPAPIIPFLKALRDDPEEYVRRSVANSLNDIAKDHPDLVIDIAKEWMEGADEKRKRLLRHACRTLLKQGNDKAMQVFGYDAVPGLNCDLNVHTPIVNYGDKLSFSIELSGGEPGQQVMVDYAVHFVKARGKTLAKVFKWKDRGLDKNGALKADKEHAIVPITTRKYYPGQHSLEILVNGFSMADEPFDLVMPEEE